eukprot:1139054-Pelagomonas_calceolata.AAC.2
MEPGRQGSTSIAEGTFGTRVPDAEQIEAGTPVSPPQRPKLFDGLFACRKYQAVLGMLLGLHSTCGNNQKKQGVRMNQT